MSPIPLKADNTMSQKIMATIDNTVATSDAFDENSASLSKLIA